MNILLIGQCTLHWGRMEFGNIGNYYIIEPFIRELYDVFPEAKIRTTFQMSERFCIDENIEVIPMSLYYGWENDLELALKELGSSEIYSLTGVLPFESEYIKEVKRADLVIDFSGDIWGDNADFLGGERFLVGLIKDRVAQLLEKKTVMLAGSPGPFNNQNTLEFAKVVYENFDLVTNRESISIDLLNNYGFNTSKTQSLACPAFLFEPKPIEKVRDKINSLNAFKQQKPVVGFIICGWNFLNGPFDKWPRDDSEYEVFAKAVEYLSEDLNAHVVLMSHSNGFPIPPKDFELIHGRDYHVIKQLESVLIDRKIAQNFSVLNQVLDAWETKSVISHFDMLVSGRIHGAVAGLSQYVPTVIIDYGHEPKAHKLLGFAIEAGAEDYVADPALENDLISKIDKAFKNRVNYKSDLINSIKEARNKAKSNFRLLKNIVS